MSKTLSYYVDEDPNDLPDEHEDKVDESLVDALFVVEDSSVSTDLSEFGFNAFPYVIDEFSSHRVIRAKQMKALIAASNECGVILFDYIDENIALMLVENKSVYTHLIRREIGVATRGFGRHKIQWFTDSHL